MQKQQQGQQAPGLAMEVKQDPEAEPTISESSERYYCPYPGCKRSFAELWRLKVHYR